MSNARANKVSVKYSCQLGNRQMVVQICYLFFNLSLIPKSEYSVNKYDVQKSCENNEGFNPISYGISIPAVLWGEGGVEPTPPA